MKTRLIGFSVCIFIIASALGVVEAALQNPVPLTNDDVISVDLNDAPKGIPKEQQKDNERELPAATGVIDLVAFLSALQKIGYDGTLLFEIGAHGPARETLKQARKARERMEKLLRD